MIFVFPGAILLGTVLLVVLPWPANALVAVLVAAAAVVLVWVVVSMNARSERAYRDVVYQANRRAGIGHDEAQETARKAARRIHLGEPP